jgi:lipoprotein-releasing system ATP-binding protein
MKAAANPIPTAQPKPPHGGAVLVADGITKSFRIGERQLGVLHGVNLALPMGQSAALVGASGAGKSTLLHILGLLDPPSSGKVWFEGRDAWALDPKERSRLRNLRVGFVFQFYHLLPELSAIENVILPAMIRHGRGAYLRLARSYRERAQHMLAEFGLTERMKHKPGQLSGGERQRVALARALFNDPAVLICDEPTGNLDSHTGERVLELLFAEQARRGVSLLIVTHDARVAARCQTIFEMQDGLVRNVVSSQSGGG